MMRRVSLALVSLVATASAAQAHAFGERYDLPVPLWMNVAGGSAVVVLSFVMAAWFLKPERQALSPRANLLTTWLRPLAGAPALLAVQFLCVFLFVVALLAGF